MFDDIHQAADIISLVWEIFTHRTLDYLGNYPDGLAYCTSGKQCLQTLNGKVTFMRKR